jgi:catechol 2,3-dioxygenase-like lactoylglutathione lyase family enzyme
MNISRLDQTTSRQVACWKQLAVFALCGMLTSTASLADTGEDPDRVPITDRIWQEAVVSVTDLDRTARFFREIGGYEDKWNGNMTASELRSWGISQAEFPDASAEVLLLGPPGIETGLVRLVRFDHAGRKEPMRPGGHAWDTGCYFSLMVRMKGMQDIYDDAIDMGWWTETAISYLEFGTSKLNVVVFKGPDGVQVQGYERLEPPLPVEIPEFSRMTQPFNMMQMVRDRDVAYDFFTGVLGFDTFYKGKPYLDAEPTFMPLGIPYNLTTSVAYQAGIVYPVKGEFGRMEMIEIIDLEGHDYADRCDAPNLGILAVRFPLDDAAAAQATLEDRGWPIESAHQPIVVEPYGSINLFAVKTPDGAIVQFYSQGAQ